MLNASPSVLSFAALAWFTILLIYSVLSQRRFWLVFPLVVLTVPNAINDLIPNQSMSAESILWNPPTFSVLTHIDIFLVAGLLRFGHYIVSTRSVQKILIAILITFSAALLYASEIWDINQVFGLFQLRYMFLLMLCYMLMRPYDFFPDFSKGLAVAVVLLGLEASIFSYLYEIESGLTSGNLGLNPLGHLAAGSFVYFFALRNQPYWRLLSIPLLALLIGILAFNQTRGSILAAGATIFVIQALKHRDWKAGATTVLLLSAIFLAVSFSPLGQGILRGIWVAISDISLTDQEFRTEESSSIITRFALWNASIKLILDNILFGVGPGGWAIFKNDYIESVRYMFLLDPHNEALNFIASYGIAMGLLFYIQLVIYPVSKVHIFARPSAPSDVRAAYSFVLVIFLTGLSNSTLWKHQVLALTGFMTLYLYHYLKFKVVAEHHVPRRSMRTAKNVQNSFEKTK